MTGLDSSSSGRASLPSPISTASFWLREPSPVLLGHRTTTALPTQADVIIIGSGITGAFAAHYLAEAETGKDLSVVMLEAREACWGATGRNGGHCQPKLFGNPPHISRFELANFRNVEALVREHNITCDWEPVVSVRGFMSKDVFDTAIADVALTQSLDPELGKLVRVVTRDDPAFADLQLGDAVLGAVVQQYSASLWPYKMIAWLLETLLSRGSARFNLQTNTPVIQLQKLDDGTWVVHTERGMIAAKKILLATNAYTSHLLPEFIDLIVPLRGEMSALHPPDSLRPNTGTPLNGVYSYGFVGNAGQHSIQQDYLQQRPFQVKDGNFTGGQLMYGGGRGFAAGRGIGVSDDSTIDDPVAKYLRAELNTELLLPTNGGKELQASHEWSGIMGYSRDGMPWCGQVPVQLGGGAGLWICAGFTGHGMPNASLCARHVAGGILGHHSTNADLPLEFLISELRVAIARKLPKVQEFELLPDTFHC